MEPITLPAKYFDCLAPAERNAVWTFSGYPLIPRTFLFEAELNVIFIAYAPLWYEIRRDAFCGNFQVTKSTIEIDGVEVVIYTPPLLWPLEVNQLARDGDIALSDPLCKYATFSDV